MLDIHKLNKSYENTVVLNDISFAIHRGHRAGLVGANGVGKSTLLKIITGIETADSGRISCAPSVIKGYLPQSPPSFGGHTIAGLVHESVGNLTKLAARMRRLEQDMTTSYNSELTNIMKEYGDISTEFERRGGYNMDHNIEKVMEGLGIGYLDKSRSIATLSGGEQTRIGIAILLLQSPDLLALDEPTNNLDWQSLTWLEEYLVKYQGAVITASHDRKFLNNIVTEILEIDEHTRRLKKYAGDYDAYKLAKENERTKWEEDYRQQQEEIRELNRVIKATGNAVTHRRAPKPTDDDKHIPHWHEQHAQKTASHVIRTAEKRLERIVNNPVPKPPRPLQFKAELKSSGIRSDAVIRATGIFKRFDAVPILKGIDFSLGYNSRTVITGLNGTGKTTLLRILAGLENADDGTVVHAPSLRIGLLQQEPQVTVPDTTVLEYYAYGRTGNRNDFMSELLSAGIFNREDIDKKVRQLSLGQLRRLELARMIAEEPNTLILDEPTNFISLDVLEALENAITFFPGPVLSVSHDRRFIEKCGSEIWELDNGILTYRGDMTGGKND